MIMALLLDISNILGGLLLAVPLLYPLLLRRWPAHRGRFRHGWSPLARWSWLVGVAALVAGGYYLIVHLFSGPRVFHFEIVGLAVGTLLLWERLTGREPLAPVAPAGASGTAGAAELSGRALLVSVFGLIAVVVGIQGLFTPD